MKTEYRYYNLLITLFAALILSSMGGSCTKEDLQTKKALFNPSLKDIKLNTGLIKNKVTINAKTWSVEYVKDGASGKMLKDKNGGLMFLDESGIIELKEGWLELEKQKANNQLIISLKENFSIKPRKFLIGIFADGKKDVISFTQSRGDGYAIVKKEITEVPGNRREYKSGKECIAIELTNNSSVAKFKETNGVFKAVDYVSQFNSEDYGAFSWMDSQDTLISMDEINKGGQIVWSGQVPYKEGYSLQSYTKASDKQELLVPPYSTIKVRGEINYLERKCHYSFTVKNLSSGNLFKISGIWSQKLPLSANTIIYQ